MSNEFPAFFFHKHLGRKKVKSAEERAALGPGWADSPTGTDAAFAEAHGGANDPEAPLASPVTSTDVAADVVTTAAPPAVNTDPLPTDVPVVDVDPAVADEQAKQAIWSTPVGVLVESLADASRDVLERIKGYEEQRPDGARVTLVRVIDKALEALPADVTDPASAQ